MTRPSDYKTAHVHSRGLWVTLLAYVVLVAGCKKPEVPRLPEPTTQITVTAAKLGDFPIIEAATGAETSLLAARDYDPTAAATDISYVRLSFPVHVAVRLRVGQPVHMNSFGDPDTVVVGNIREIRPALDNTTLTREVIVEVPGGTHWHPVGSVRGEVTLGVHARSVVVPELAVILRPAGTVVYVIEKGIARERRVKTGLAQGDLVEVTKGLSAGTTVAVEGASLLSEGAKVTARAYGSRRGGAKS